MHRKRLPGSRQTYLLDEHVAVRTGCPVLTNLWPYVEGGHTLVNIKMYPTLTERSRPNLRYSTAAHHW